jgi:hypothetical protein
MPAAPATVLVALRYLATFTIVAPLAPGYCVLSRRSMSLPELACMTYTAP